MNIENQFEICRLELERSGLLIWLLYYLRDLNV